MPKVITMLLLLLWLVSPVRATGGFLQTNHCPVVQHNFIPARIALLNFSQEKVVSLKLYDSLKREISGGQTHAFSISLAAKQYARIVVEQQGIDLILKVKKPDGRSLFKLGNPAGATGPEVVSIISGLAGDYGIEVSAADDGAAAGNYEIRLEEVSVPSASARERFAAEQLYAEGWQHQSLGESEQALAKFDKSLPLWRAAEDRYGEVNTLHNIAKAYRALTNLPKAAEYYDITIRLRQELGDRNGAAWTLNDKGAAYLHLKSPPEALEFLAQALSIFEETGNRRGQADVLRMTGFAYFKMHDMQRALELYEKALPLYREERDRSGEARTLNNMAGVYDSLGEPQKVLQLIEQAAQGWRASGDRDRSAFAINAAGKLYEDAGEWQQALDNYQQALQIFQSSKRRAEVDVRRAEAGQLDNIGLLYASLGDPDRGLKFLQQALAIRQELKEPGASAGTLSRVGYAYFLLDQPQRALEFYDQAVPLHKEVKDMPGLSFTLTVMGMAYTALNEFQKALESYDKALELQRRMPTRQGEAITLDKIGEVYTQLNNPQRALENYEQALQIWQSIKDQQGEAITLYNIARAEMVRKDWSAAARWIDSAISLIESQRTNITNYQLRSSYLAARQNYYELSIEANMQLHRLNPAGKYDVAALQASERARARVLLDTLYEANINLHEGVRPELIEREQALRQKLNAKALMLTTVLGGQNAKSDARAALTNEIDQLAAEYDALQAQIRTSSPRYAALAHSQPLSLPEIQRLLDDDMLLVEFALGREQSYAWVIGNESLHSYSLPKRAEIEQAARRVHRLLTARQQPVPGETPNQSFARIADADEQYWKEASALSQMLLGPIADLSSHKRLLIVSDGILQYLPFAALTVPPAPSVGQGAEAQTSSAQGTARAVPLLVEHEIVGLPSAAVLAVLRATPKTPASPLKAVAVLADPVFDKDDPRLSTGRGRKAVVTSDLSRSRPVRSRGRAVTPRGKMRTQAKSQVANLQRAFRESEAISPSFALSRLPGTRQEADAIMATIPRGHGMSATDFKANCKPETIAVLENYGVIHFATHGLIDSERPELSGLVLSLVDEEGRPQNGFLRLNDIYKLRLAADLVVLSACNTGLGKEIKGEGLIGLTRGFMYAGSPRVIASLWKVDDDATATLMQRFYQLMLSDKKPVAVAFREAQLELMKQKRWNAPYYWAAFVLQGESK